MVKISEKIKASVLDRLKQIENKSFDDDTIKLLLIEIREYIPKGSFVHELADFVAHPDKDRGIIFETVNYMYFRSKVMFQQIHGGAHLDLNNLSLELFQTARWHFSKVKPDKKKLDRLEKLFKFDRTARVYHPTKPIPAEILTDLKQAISLISVQPAISEADIKTDFISTISSVTGTDTSTLLNENWEEILLSLLVLLHGSTFAMSDGQTAPAYIGLSLPKTGQEPPNLGLLGLVNPEKGRPGISFYLIETQLMAHKFLAPELMDEQIGAMPRGLKKSMDDLHLSARRTSGTLIIAPKS